MIGLRATKGIVALLALVVTFGVLAAAPQTSSQGSVDGLTPRALEQLVSEAEDVEYLHAVLVGNPDGSV